MRWKVEAVDEMKLACGLDLAFEEIGRRLGSSTEFRCCSHYIPRRPGGANHEEL